MKKKGKTKIDKAILKVKESILDIDSMLFYDQSELERINERLQPYMDYLREVSKTNKEVDLELEFLGKEMYRAIHGIFCK